MSNRNQAIRALAGDLARRQPMVFRVAAITNPGWRPLAVTRQTDITIEGFPRSANTFAIVSFASSNPGARIAHHLHSPAQVRRSVRLGIPTLFLLRAPIDAVASLVVRHNVPPEKALKAYASFYADVAAMADALTLSSFERTTSDLASAVRVLNARTGGRFQQPPSDPTKVAEVFATIEAINSRKGGSVDESSIARPSSARDTGLEMTRARIVADAPRSLLETCEGLHRALTDLASSQFTG